MKFLARLKLRFDIGQSFLTIVNFAFIVLAASDKISTWIHLPAKILVPILVPAGLAAVWLFGYLLDRLRFMDAYQDETNDRNQMLRQAIKK